MPLVSKTFDQLLDFTRTSAATFVNSEGDIQTTAASRNLLLWTQQFDNAAWSKAACTITANAGTAPDGTNTADDVTSTGTDLLSQAATVASGATVAYSQYFKRGNHDWVRVGILSGGDDVRVWFNIATGVVGTTAVGGAGVAVGASIVDFGNGWYRCTVVGSLPASTSYTCLSASATADNVFTRVASGVRRTWGAQLEAASTASTYTRNNGGVFPPRFDYDPVTLAAKGLLIEEQRTNLVTYSEQFDNGAWAKNSVAITANAATSPTGGANAEKVIVNNGTFASSVGQIYAKPASSAPYTFSVYAKAGEWNSVAIYSVGGLFSNRASVFVNLLTGAITTAANAIGTFTNASAVVTHSGNGWYKIALTVTTDTALSGGVYIYPANNNAFATGDGTSGIYIWGAQLEAGAFATSYIPTVASQVTRSRDLCSIVAPNFAPWYNQSEGTFVVGYDVDSTTITLPKTTAVVHDGTTSNRIYGYLSGAAAPVVLVTTGGVAQASLVAASVSANTVNQMAFAYRANDVALSSNGGAVLTDTSATVPTVDQLSVGGFTPTAAFLNGHIRSIRYYPTRLSDAQLQALTA